MFVALITLAVVVAVMVNFLAFAMWNASAKPDKALVKSNHRLATSAATTLSNRTVGGVRGEITRDFYPCGYDMGIAVQTPYLTVRWDPPRAEGTSALDDLAEQMRSRDYTVDHATRAKSDDDDGVHTVHFVRHVGSKVIHVDATKVDPGVKLWRAEYPESIANPYPAVTAYLTVRPSGCDAADPDS